MENNIPSAISSDAIVFQVGCVVRNLEKSMENWSTLFGIGPWVISEFCNEKIQDNLRLPQAANEQFHFRLATTYMGSMQIEVIEANETMPMYWDFINTHGDGIHHIKLKIPDESREEVLAFFKSKGIEHSFSGRFYNVVFDYVDTTDWLGFPLELGNCVKLIRND